MNDLPSDCTKPTLEQIICYYNVLFLYTEYKQIHISFGCGNFHPYNRLSSRATLPAKAENGYSRILIILLR